NLRLRRSAETLVSHRTIHELIDAAFAGDPLTRADAKRLRRHIHHTDRTTALLNTPIDWPRAVLQEPFDVARRLILRDLRKRPASEIRALVRWLLVLLGTFAELTVAHEGKLERLRRDRQRAAIKSGAQKRTHARAILDMV